MAIVYHKVEKINKQDSSRVNKQDKKKGDVFMIRFLMEHAEKNTVSFHMPGHKGSNIFRKYGFGEYLDRIVDCDITEIPGADNLFQAEGIIKDVQDRYAALYDAKDSYLQINGSSGGIIAAILASVKPGQKLILARNCHKSVFNAITLGGIVPVYAQPEFVGEYGISGEMTVSEIRRCLDENPDAAAVIITSPNYYGICSDIEGIAEEVHSRGKILIVDQAHGAHLKVFEKYGYGEDMPKSAEESNADIIIESIHKTLASITQSAILNLNSDRVDSFELKDKLQMIESSSPSYIMMGFLEMNLDILENYGREAIGEWKEYLDIFRKELSTIPGLKIIDRENMDHTKVNLDMSAYGMDGAAFEKKLMEYGIYPELHAGNLVMLMTGIGNTEDDYKWTVDSIRRIAEEYKPIEGSEEISKHRMPKAGRFIGIPREKKMIPIDKAIGRVCAGSITPYPPGIPCVCPGEEITEEMVSYIENLRADGEKVIGIDDQGRVPVGI